MKMRIGALGAGTAEMVLPYSEALVGDPVTGVLHGGAISALMDSCCGAAVFMALQTPSPIATLDLRIDYLRSATPGRDITCAAHCYKLGKNVAFVRATAFHDDPDQLVASAAGAFMVGTHMPGVVPP